MIETKQYTWMESLPSHIKVMFQKLSSHACQYMQEVRLRVARPLMVYSGGKEYGIDLKGLCSVDVSYQVTQQDIDHMMKLLSGFSFYTLEEAMKQGFVTIEGGHRIGLVGRVVQEGGVIKTIKHISGLNIRIAHEVIGCSKQVMPYIVNRQGVYHTLIVSPPKCGKTTLLRDIIRNLSNGYSGYKPLTVGLVDERSEIAGCYQGIPQNDVGLRTDVLDGCQKAEGMRMMLRAMGPEVLAVDEIGSERDLLAIEEALGAGVGVLCTAHGKDVEDCMKKPVLRRMLEYKLFDKIIILSNRNGVCTVEDVVDLKARKVSVS